MLFNRSYLIGIVLIICLLIVGGCLGKGTQKDTRFYLLQPISGMSADREHASIDDEGIGLAIGPVRVREYLTRPQIVTRTQGNKIILHDFHSWGESLDRNFTMVLAENLGNLLATDRIVIFPWRRRPNFDYQIVVDVVRFDGELGVGASLMAHYYIWDVGEGAELGRGRRLSTGK
ncbi:MAG: PqiC family protein [Syntrophobacterales bacterium]